MHVCSVAGGLEIHTHTLGATGPKEHKLCATTSTSHMCNSKLNISLALSAPKNSHRHSPAIFHHRRGIARNSAMGIMFPCYDRRENRNLLAVWIARNSRVLGRQGGLAAVMQELCLFLGASVTSGTSAGDILECRRKSDSCLRSGRP